MTISCFSDKLGDLSLFLDIFFSFGYAYCILFSFFRYFTVWILDTTGTGVGNMGGILICIGPWALLCMFGRVVPCRIVLTALHVILRLLEGAASFPFVFFSFFLLSSAFFRFVNTQRHAWQGPSGHHGQWKNYLIFCHIHCAVDP